MKSVVPRVTGSEPPAAAPPSGVGVLRFTGSHIRFSEDFPKTPGMTPGFRKGVSDAQTASRRSRPSPRHLSQLGALAPLSQPPPPREAIPQSSAGTELERSVGDRNEEALRSPQEW